MQRKAILILICLLMGGCSIGGIRLGFPGVYRIDIPQGNVINQERWDYLHSMEIKGSPRTQENLSLFFDKDVLVRISGDYAPSQAPSVAPAENRENEEDQ